MTLPPALLALDRPHPPELAEIEAVVAALDPAPWLELLQADTDRPYGRRVVYATPDLEVMLATWTPGAACAPHDHGGASGVVRVLRGDGLHHQWRVDPTGLVDQHSHRFTAGDRLVVTSDLVHSMADARGEQPLVTLHVYVRAITEMVVYDAETHETLLVDGTCGAWVPEPDAPVLRREAGIVAPAAIRTAAK